MKSGTFRKAVWIGGLVVALMAVVAVWHGRSQWSAWGRVIEPGTPVELPAETDVQSSPEPLDREPSAPQRSSRGTGGPEATQSPPDRAVLVRVADQQGVPLVGLELLGCGGEIYAARGSARVSVVEPCDLLVVDELKGEVGSAHLTPGQSTAVVQIAGLDARGRAASQLFLLEQMVNGMEFSSDEEADAYARMLNPHLDLLVGIEAGDTGLWSDPE